MVKVERMDLVPPKPPAHDFQLRPYAERRATWGGLGGIAYSSYNPTNYAPAFLGANFTDVYAKASSPLIEGQLVVKRNFGFGSAGVELGMGYYAANSTTNLINSELQLYQYRVGGIVILDELFTVPYVAPYASGGAYIMTYNEQMGANSLKGNSQVAPYFTLGVQATLDWIDSDNARIAYKEGGIQSTFLFLEGRSYLASNAKGDPNFGASFVLGGGLRLELTGHRRTLVRISSSSS